MSVVNQVKERLDLVDTVSEYVTLKKSGQNHKGLCPFHTEKTPSFVVFPETQTWHCFGACSTGGDVFTFIEQIEGVEFGDALEMLAERAGVELAPRTEADIERAEALGRLREVNAAAARYYHNLLVNSPAGQVARKYLENRGIQHDAWETFELGYALGEWDALLGYLTGKRHYSPEDLAAVGLVSERRDGTGHYDRFRGRLMFPIRDVSGDVIGFGARALLPDDMPKYLNSPQTDLFDKSHVLYGIDRARQAIRQVEQAIIVEGYTDVITAQTHGFENVVASLGTALTETQLRTLKRYTRRFILALDADVAGTQATLRGLDVAKEALDTESVPVPTARGYIRYESRLDAEIRALVLPAGMDPDDLIREDADEWSRLVETAVPVVEFVLQVQTADLDLTDPKDKSTAVDRLLPVIADIGSPVEREHYLQELARRVQVDERVLAQQLGRVSSRPRRRVRSAPEPRSQEPRRRPAGSFGAEEYVLASLLDRPFLWSYLQQHFTEMEAEPLNAADFTAAANRAVYELFEELWSSGRVHNRATLLEELRATLTSALNDELDFLTQHTAVQPPVPDQEQAVAVLKATLRLREQARRREIERWRFVLETAESSADAETARTRVRERTVELSRLQRALAGRDKLPSDARL
ncbi:MAG: DNA primase [Anaerolineales bacterium]|nr:DNA primase [Anaerolineales bacterium]